MRLFSAYRNRIKGETAEQQVYLNTGRWMSRLALPAPGEVTSELVAWLYEPDRGHIPLREVPPQCVFALINAAEGLLARVCVSGGVAVGSIEYWHNDDVYRFTSQELLRGFAI